MASTKDMMLFLALLPGVVVMWCWAEASGLGCEGQYGRTVCRTLGAPPLPRLRGRVGVGALAAAGLAERGPPPPPHPPGPPPPSAGGGKKKKHPRRHPPALAHTPPLSPL